MWNWAKCVTSSSWSEVGTSDVCLSCDVDLHGDHHNVEVACLMRVLHYLVTEIKTMSGIEVDDWYEGKNDTKVGEWY